MYLSRSDVMDPVPQALFGLVNQHKPKKRGAGSSRKSKATIAAVKLPETDLGPFGTYAFGARRTLPKSLYAIHFVRAAFRSLDVKLGEPVVRRALDAFAKKMPQVSEVRRLIRVREKSIGLEMTAAPPLVPNPVGRVLGFCSESDKVLPLVVNPLYDPLRDAELTNLGVTLFDFPKDWVARCLMIEPNLYPKDPEPVRFGQIYAVLAIAEFGAGQAINDTHRTELQWVGETFGPTYFKRYAYDENKHQPLFLASFPLIQRRVVESVHAAVTQYKLARANQVSTTVAAPSRFATAPGALGLLEAFVSAMGGDPLLQDESLFVTDKAREALLCYAPEPVRGASTIGWAHMTTSFSTPIYRDEGRTLFRRGMSRQYYFEDYVLALENRQKRNAKQLLKEASEAERSTEEHRGRSPAVIFLSNPKLSMDVFFQDAFVPVSDFNLKIPDFSTPRRFSAWQIFSGLITMPEYVARQTIVVVRVWRALARFAAMLFLSGAVMPVPCGAQDGGSVLWVPRIDHPETMCAVGALWHLLQPFVPELQKVMPAKPNEGAEAYVIRALILTLAALGHDMLTPAISKSVPDDVRMFYPSAEFRFINRDWRSFDHLPGIVECAASIPLAMFVRNIRPAMTLTHADGAIGIREAVIRKAEDATETWVDAEDFTEDEHVLWQEWSYVFINLSRALNRDKKNPVDLNELIEDTDHETLDAAYLPFRFKPQAFRTITERIMPIMASAGIRMRFAEGFVNDATPAFYLSVSEGQALSSGGLLSAASLAEFEWKIALGTKTITREELEALLAQAGELTLFSGNFYYIDPIVAEELRRQLAEPERSDERMDAWEKCRALLSGRVGNREVRASEALRRKVDELLDAQPLEIPSEITAQLRPYQKRGFEWLIHNLNLGLGALIADDMGLGKTLQVITAVQYLKKQGELDRASILVVAPASLLVNWKREFERFAPGLTVHVNHGANRSLPVADTEDDKGNVRQRADVDVVLTSYALLRKDAEALGQYAWRLMVLDEAQAIKSHSTGVAKAARLFPVSQVIGMTGTPVENKLLDYWSILSVVQPGLLPGKTEFEREFAKPIETGGLGSVTALESFRKLTKAFILRRLKTDPSVISDLPEKNVIDRFTELTKAQTVMYAKLLKEGLGEIRSAVALPEGNASNMQRKGRVLALITRLKQVTDSPSLITGEIPEKPDAEKAEALLELLDEAREAGNKTLVFTQYAEMGERLKTWIEASGIAGDEVPFIRGDVSIKARQAMIDRFQTDPACRVMILTLKSGGVGLNLTAANVVIHYDLWWNPAVEEQATDRAFRIGQQKDVLVYRFISAGTFEERVNAMLSAKRKLADLTVGTGEKWIGDMTDEELEAIFRLGD